MANDNLLDFLGDGASADTILSYVHIQTVGYGGIYNDYAVPVSANFPPTGKDNVGATINPTRFIVRLNYTPFSNGSLPILVKDVTGSVTLTPTTGSPALNQYRWWYSANNSTILPSVIEFNSGQAGHIIAVDCYTYASIANANRFIMINDDNKPGDINLTSPQTLTDYQILENNVVIIQEGLYYYSYNANFGITSQAYGTSSEYLSIKIYLDNVLIKTNYLRTLVFIEGTNQYFYEGLINVVLNGEIRKNISDTVNIKIKIDETLRSLTWVFRQPEGHLNLKLQ